jgi:dCTP deaminase
VSDKYVPEPAGHGAIGRAEILRLMSEPDLAKRLYIRPLLDPERQVGVCSVDLRLGCEFIASRRTNIAYLSPLAQSPSDQLKWQEPFLVPRRKELVLHPGDLILGSTLEYVRLPAGMAGFVTSRSSWGRVGLVIATAIAIHPGYRGIITLELTNVGTVPLRLCPGVRVAQIVFNRSSGEGEYGGNFDCPTAPAVGNINEPDLDFWRRA